MRYRTYGGGRGILTPFPFGGYLLGPALGPANSRLTTIAGKPWPFRREGFSPSLAVTAAGICTCGRSSGPHGPPSDLPQRPPYPVRLSEPHRPGLGARLEPRPIFGAPSLGG